MSGIECKCKNTQAGEGAAVAGPSSGAGAGQPGPPPKKLRIDQVASSAEVKKEDMKEKKDKETSEEEEVGEKVSALEKEVKLVKKTKESQDAMLAANLESARFIAQEKKKINETFLRESAEINKAEQMVKFKGGELKEKIKEKQRNLVN